MTRRRMPAHSGGGAFVRRRLEESGPGRHELEHGAVGVLELALSNVLDGDAGEVSRVLSATARFPWGDPGGQQQGVGGGFRRLPG